MKSTGDPSNKNIWLSGFSMKAMTVGGEVGCLTLLIVLLAVFGGLWLDKILGTKPLITVFLVLGSAPAALVLTVWVARRAVKDWKPSSTAKTGTKLSSQPLEGDDDQ